MPSRNPPHPSTAQLPAEARSGAHWVKPNLVAQVRFATWTADSPRPPGRLPRPARGQACRPGHPRNFRPHPALLQARRQIRLPPHPHPPHRSQAFPNGQRRTVNVQRKTYNEQRPSPRPSHPPHQGPRPRHLTSPSRRSPTTTGPSPPLMLPHIAGRPLSLVRCPDGAAKPCFFQKHVNSMLPPGIGSVPVPDKKTGVIEPYITLVHARSPRWPGPARRPRGPSLGLAQRLDLEHPDRLIFDLDPDESLPWSAVTAAATDVRTRLKKARPRRASSRPPAARACTSSSPSNPKLSWADAERLRPPLRPRHGARQPRPLPHQDDQVRPHRPHLPRLPPQRARRHRRRPLLAPRPRRRNVSMPLAWTELLPATSPPPAPPSASQTSPTWRARLGKDPWKAIASTHQTITPALLAALSDPGHV